MSCVVTVAYLLHTAESCAGPGGRHRAVQGEVAGVQLDWLNRSRVDVVCVHFHAGVAGG